MKILLLSDGRSVHTRRWTAALKHRGMDVVLYSITPVEDDFYLHLGVPCHVYDLFTYSRKNLPASLISHLKAVRYLKKLIAEEKPDILHAHYLTSYSLIAALSGFHPLVSSMWGSDIYSFPKQSVINRLAVEWILKKSDAVLSTSKAMAEEARKYTDKEIQITPFGVDLTLFRKMERSEDGVFRMGTVKTLSANYGISDLIETFRLVKEANPDLKCELVLVGEGKDREKLQQQAAASGLGDAVRFAGRVEHNRLPEYYSTFDVALFLSLRESFGVSAVEAMACEVPVVATATDGFKEVLEDGRYGKIVPVGDPAAAAQAVQFFIDHPEKIRKFGEMGRNKVEKSYNWDENISTMLSIYNSVLKNII